MKQTQKSSQTGIKPEEIKPEALNMPYLPYIAAGRSQVPMDTTQIRQKIKIGTFDITGTGTFDMNIGYIPSLLIIKAYEDGHAPYSEAIITSQENHCVYNDSGGNYGEATTNTVVYLSHAGLTTATLTDFGQISRITCSSYNHAAMVHWQAYP